MERNRAGGDERRQAPDAEARASGRAAGAPGLALPTDLGRSLRLLDDEQLDRLATAVNAEIGRRGRNATDDLPAARALQADKPVFATPAGPKPAAPDRAASLTPGQKSLVLAAFEAGLRPAAIARQFRLPQEAVRQAVAAVRRGRRPER